MPAVSGCLSLLALLHGVKAQGLVGPGAMTQYSGGRNTQRGYGTVREPAEGFFIGGSSVKEMVSHCRLDPSLDLRPPSPLPILPQPYQTLSATGGGLQAGAT